MKKKQIIVNKAMLRYTEAVHDINSHNYPVFISAAILTAKCAAIIASIKAVGSFHHRPIVSDELFLFEKRPFSGFRQ